MEVTEFADWYDVADPALVDAMAELDISGADHLRDRREMKRVFHAFGLVRNEADGRMAIFPSASVGKMLYMSGTDVRGIAAAFADLYRKSLRAWSEPNRKIPATDRRRMHEAVHQYVAKFRNAQGRFYVRFTVKANTGGASPRSEVHASVISRIGIYKTESAELSTPAKTRAEDSATFIDDKIAFFLSEVNRARFAGGASPSSLPGGGVGTPEGGGLGLPPPGEIGRGGSVPTTAAGGRRQARITEA